MKELIQLLKLVIFGAVIVFLSLTVQVYYAPTEFEQADARYECLSKIQARYRHYYTTATFHKNGQGISVLLIPNVSVDDPNVNLKSVHCVVKNGELIRHI